MFQYFHGSMFLFFYVSKFLCFDVSMFHVSMIVDNRSVWLAESGLFFSKGKEQPKCFFQRVVRGDHTDVGGRM